MPVDILLNELHKVRQNGPDKWMACCPAHDDKSPSLSIKECSDGHILVHCFAGCEPSEILASIGLKMSDLFPERDQHYFDDQPPQSSRRESKGEADLAHRQIRFLTAEAMVAAGHKLTREEKQTSISDYKYLREIGKLP